MRALIILLMGTLCVIAWSGVANGTALEDGVAWLHDNQDPSGLWGTEQGTPIRDTAVTLDVLCSLGADSAGVPYGLDVLLGKSSNSVDYLARKILAIASYTQGEMESGLVNRLAAQQNSDGGWGYRAGYGSNIHDTALALRALKAGGYSNLTVQGSGISYLTSSQNGDGGFSFAAGDSSLVYYTAQVTLALSMYEGEFDVAQELQDTVTWLKSQPHLDGGFGSGSSGNPYETGLAIVAIAKGDPLAGEITDARGFLETTQLPDGSWSGDTYSTAMAVWGLSYVGPDLAISIADIVLSNPTPADGDLVTITATIRNRGVAASGAAVVQVFDGDPDLGSFQIGSDQALPGLSPGEDSPIQVEWDTDGLAGDHEIYVLVDPFDVVEEPDELNNVGVKPVHVYIPPDLFIESITFDPAEPESTDTVIIKITVRNAGEVTAYSVTLQVWDSEEYLGGVPPDEPPGTPLLYPPYTIPSIPPGSTFTLNVNMGNYFDSAGGYFICSCADVDDTIEESNEYNNCDCNTLWISMQCREVSLNADLNLLGLPLEPLDITTSYNLLPEIMGCTEIDGWDRISQNWISAVDAGDGTVIGEDFSIDLRDGFFARVTEATLTDLCGRNVTDHGCTQLETGLNMLSVPNEDACYGAFTLIDDISNCVEAHSWDSGLQNWVSATKVGEDEFVGEDFPVTPSAGYFVKVDAGSEWCTSPCDTMASLPDLLITSADIWLDPNPVGSGETVGIYVNMHNIGTETAYNPRLDIWAGDPDDGGSQLISGYLPVNIPPGESSGYYGNEFIFTGSGFIDIYGIADYYDDIEELNETNNQAYQTLQVLALGAASSAVALGGPADQPLRSMADQGSAVSKITDVVVGNQSSSSVTISWITDAPTGGCVEYGPPTALNSSERESGSSRRVHQVVLRNLGERTDYYFRVVSGGITDDNRGRYYSFTTASSGVGTPSIAYGHVVSSGTGRGLSGVRVLGTLLRSGEAGTYPLLAETDANGAWILNLGNLKDPVSGIVKEIVDGDQFLLEFAGGEGLSGSKTVVYSGDSPQDCGKTGIRLEIEPPDLSGLAPDNYYLAMGAPNPFRAGTIIRFGMPRDGHIEITLYNVAGQRVARLLDQEHAAGNHAVQWDGRTGQGNHLASSGIYFCRMKADGFTRIRKLFLLR